VEAGGPVESLKPVEISVRLTTMREATTLIISKKPYRKF
jgi:hypothetical protein